jgi:hypothetical protein
MSGEEWNERFKELLSQSKTLLTMSRETPDSPLRRSWAHQKAIDMGWLEPDREPGGNDE